MKVAVRVGIVPKDNAPKDDVRKDNGFEDNDLEDNRTPDLIRCTFVNGLRTNKSGSVMQITSSLNSSSTHQAKSVKREKSDEALVTSVAKGNAAALETLFNRHQGAIYRFVLRLTKNASLAEETVSEVFLEVWRGADKFEGKCQVSTWLLAIARNKAVGALRQCKESQLDDNAAMGIKDAADDPEENLVKQERGSLVQRCLSQLPPVHREIIDLYYFRENSVSKVVDLVGIPASTVKTRMFYARNRMVQLLELAGITSARI